MIRSIFPAFCILEHSGIFLSGYGNTEIPSVYIIHPQVAHFFYVWNQLFKKPTDAHWGFLFFSWPVLDWHNTPHSVSDQTYFSAGIALTCCINIHLFLFQSTDSLAIYSSELSICSPFFIYCIECTKVINVFLILQQFLGNRPLSHFVINHCQYNSVPMSSKHSSC